MPFWQVRPMLHAGSIEQHGCMSPPQVLPPLVLPLLPPPLPLPIIGQLVLLHMMHVELTQHHR